MSSRVIIVGGGVVGVSTLYELAARCVPALLLEARDGVALETSFANGAMMTPSMSSPWNSPGVWRHMAASLFDPHSPMKLRWNAIPRLLPWGLKFLRHSTQTEYQRATLAAYILAAYSTELTERRAHDLGLEEQFNDRGCMKIFEKQENFAAACADSEALTSLGLKYCKLDPEEAVDREPLLSNIKDRLAGALFYPNDRSSDARKFTEALSAASRQAGARVRTKIHVKRLLVDQGKVIGVDTNAGVIAADQVVICAGNGSPDLARQAGVRLSISPVKGYSLTFKLRTGARMPSLPVIDDAMHAGIVPLGDRIRAVGTAEFTGLDRSLAPERLENLRRIFRRLYPQLARQVDTATEEPWTNFRPMSADHLPFIGPAGPRGLYFNTGHGYLGWTLASGSARMLADIMEHKRPEIDAAPYQVLR